ncbi:hypothetical protein K443DRAFT_12820 [Laccaria amethystina LaAM-08-1]|uniref:Kinesin light chain n=1 Tax=Laccaria amethystina LaAM-08-1 TaxID=1095629 RepID=A0A0C9X7G4_9AGAR|nr:hypothetical protein K443DRAFT_12820 [Laccaria amethystina LaAM-08-1]
MANLAATYSNLGKYKEAEKLEIQVLDARRRILGVQHPHTILAMENLAATLRSLRKYKEAEELVIQAQNTSIMNFDKKVYSLSNFIKKTSKMMSKIAHSFHKENDPNDDLTGTSS